MSTPYIPPPPLSQPSQPLPNSTRHSIPTQYGTIIAYTTTPSQTSKQETTTLLLLHGNSSSSLIFRPFFARAKDLGVRLLTFDYLGHGESDNASESGWRDAYTQVGYAKGALAVLSALFPPSQSLLVVGWSLGGHVAIEMCALLCRSPSDFPSVPIPTSILPTGTPPISSTPASAAAGFKSHPISHLFAQTVLSEEEVQSFSGQVVGIPLPSSFIGLSTPQEANAWIPSVTRRTDGRTRTRMFDAWIGMGDGGGVDQKAWVEDWHEGEVIVAVVNGKEEPFVCLEWLREEVKWNRLWRGECVELNDAAHCPFWENWDAFRPVLDDWIADFLFEKQKMI